jgi:hypothetical protein
MDRREFLAASTTGLCLGTAGCLGIRDGGDGSPYETVDLDCERFEGSFGVLYVGFPWAVPDDVTVVDIQETGILAYDIVEAELEYVRDTRSRVEDRIRDVAGRSDEAGRMIHRGYVALGSGERYETIEASLEEYDSIESGRPGIGPRWDVAYEGEGYQLALGMNSHPDSLGYPDDASSSRQSVELSATDAVPEDATVIDGLEETLDEHGYLGDVIKFAGCSDESAGVPATARFGIPSNQYMEIRDLLGESRRGDHGWYVGYDGAVHHVSLGASAG